MTVGLFSYYIVSTCFIKYLIIFRVPIPGAMTQDTFFIWNEHSIFSYLIQMMAIATWKAAFLTVKTIDFPPSGKDLTRELVYMCWKKIQEISS